MIYCVCNVTGDKTVLLSCDRQMFTDIIIVNTCVCEAWLTYACISRALQHVKLTADTTVRINILL